MAWHRTTVGDVGGLRNGLNFSKADEGTGLPVLKVKDFKARFFAPTRTLDELSLDPSELSPGHLLKTGDTVLIRSNGNTSLVGRCLYIDALPKPTTFSGFCIRFRPDVGLIDPRFASYLLRAPNSRRHFVSHGSGTSIQNLNQNTIGSFEFGLPPLPEQRAIAQVLAALDDKIELNREMNRTLEATAQAIFRSWFVDFDPVLAKADGRKPFGMSDDLAALFPDRFVKSELGPIPKGWEVSTVKREFNVTMGQSPPGHTYNKDAEGVPFFQGRTDFRFRFPSRRIYCTEPTRFAEAADTLVSVRAPVGDVNLAWERCAIGRGLSAVRHFSGSPSFTYYTVKSLEPDFTIFQGEGTLFGSMSKKKFEGIRVVAPPENVVSAFDEIAGPVDQRLHSAWSESQILATLRDLLLPKLLSGEIRVGEAEDAVEAAV